MANIDNLNRGNPETEFNARTAAEAQKKSAASRKRNNTIRKLGLQMLSTEMAVDAQTLKNARNMGFDTDQPEIQMLMLARLGAAALSKDPKLSLAAMDMIFEITGNDARSATAAEQRKLERERIKLERERLELEKQRVALEKLKYDVSQGLYDEENHFDDGFMDALKNASAEVTEDAADVPEDI